MIRMGPSDPRTGAGCDFLSALGILSGEIAWRSAIECDVGATRLMGGWVPPAIASNASGPGEGVDCIAPETGRGAIGAAATLDASVLGRKVTPCPQEEVAIAAKKGAISSHRARIRPTSEEVVNFRLDGIRIFPAPFGRGFSDRRRAVGAGIVSPAHWLPARTWRG